MQYGTYQSRSRFSGAALALLLIVFQTGLAQESGGGPHGGLNQQQLNELAKVQQEIQAIGEKLEAIEQSAVQANPELQQQQEEFRKRLMNTMQENGFQVEKNIDRLRELEQQLGQQGLDPNQRAELADEFRQLLVGLQQAEQEALQDQQVVKAREELAVSMLTAMKEQDPKTEALLERMQRAHDRMEELLPPAETPAPSGMPSPSGGTTPGR